MRKGPVLLGMTIAFFALFLHHCFDTLDTNSEDGEGLVGKS